MKSVSRFEANLLRILHCFLRRAPVDQVLALVMARSARPRCLSRNAVDLVQDALAKGCVYLLASGGGWQRARYLRGERAVEGRLWERSAPADLGLPFSRYSLDFLMWITAARPADQKPAWGPPETELTIGDRYLLYLAYAALRDTEAGQELASRLLFARHGLCRLTYPEDFTAPDVLPDLLPWTTGLGACILETMQPELAGRWLQVERTKGQRTGWQDVQALGISQERVLGPLLEAAAASQRRDLVRFLLRTLAELLPENASPDTWVGGLLNAGPRMADRAATHRAALILLHHLEPLRRWHREAQSVGYFDENYQAAQVWKADWEHWQGEVLYQRAQHVIRQLDPLRAQK
jgi:hypothetical protein